MGGGGAHGGGGVWGNGLTASVMVPCLGPRYVRACACACVRVLRACACACV